MRLGGLGDRLTWYAWGYVSFVFHVLVPGVVSLGTFFEMFWHDTSKVDFEDSSIWIVISLFATNNL